LLATALVLCTPTGAAEPTATAKDFSGTYVLLQQTVTVSELPILANVVATTRALSIQELQQVGDRLRGTGRLCALDIVSTSSLVTTEIPAAFGRALPPIVTDAQLIQSGKSLTFVQGAQTSVVGARLRNPQREALPTSSSDTRVFDQDGDGRPGMTVRVRGLVNGEVFVTQRATSSLRGSLQGNAFEGRIDFSHEQRVLGATSHFLESGPEAKPDPSRSRFRLSPVKAGTTCDQARRLAATWK
jgi:hypothetical protein